MPPPEPRPQKQITTLWPDIEKAVTEGIKEQEGHSLTDMVPVVTDTAEDLHITITRRTKAADPNKPGTTPTITRFEAEIDTFEIEHSYELTNLDAAVDKPAGIKDAIKGWAQAARQYETKEIVRRLACNATGDRVYTVANIEAAQPDGFGEMRLLVLVASSDEVNSVTRALEDDPTWSPLVHRIPALPNLNDTAAVLLRAGGGPVVHRYSDLTLDWAPVGPNTVNLVLTERLRLENPSTATRFSNP